MADGRVNNGGKREGAGRKSRSDEQNLIELLDSEIDESKQRLIIQKILELSLEGDIRAIQVYLNYRHGKPKDTVTQTHVFDGFSISDVLRPKSD